jgi:hypothetical protein
MSISPKYLPSYAYGDYLLWQGRWELIHGLLYVMMPSPSFEHQNVNTKILAQIGSKITKYQHCKTGNFLSSLKVRQLEMEFSKIW